MLDSGLRTSEERCLDLLFSPQAVSHTLDVVLLVLRQAQRSVFRSADAEGVGLVGLAQERGLGLGDGSLS